MLPFKKLWLSATPIIVGDETADLSDAGCRQWQFASSCFDIFDIFNGFNTLSFGTFNCRSVLS